MKPGVLIATLLSVACIAGCGSTPAGDPPDSATAAATPTRPEIPPEAAWRTACRSVAYIGDSTSLGLTSPLYLPDPADRLDARLRAVGVKRNRIDIAGARSIVETIPGTTNGETAARSIRSSGFHGCWIFALATNEAADIANGSAYLAPERIRIMMKVAAGDPVMWVNARTLLGDGSFYDDRNLKAWNRALVRACRGYPAMRVYDWADDARDRWYISDGIHFTTPGYTHRARLIAAGLVSAFPAGLPLPGSGGGVAGRPGSRSCLVGPAPAVLRSPRQNLRRSLRGW